MTPLPETDLGTIVDGLRRELGYTTVRYDDSWREYAAVLLEPLLNAVGINTVPHQAEQEIVAAALRHVNGHATPFEDAILDYPNVHVSSDATQRLREVLRVGMGTYLKKLNEARKNSEFNPNPIPDSLAAMVQFASTSNVH